MSDFDPVQWITTQEAAELTGYSTARFRQLAKKGSILGRKFGRDWFLSRSAVIEYYQKMQRLGALKHNPWKPGGRERKEGAE